MLRFSKADFYRPHTCNPLTFSGIALSPAYQNHTPEGSGVPGTTQQWPHVKPHIFLSTRPRFVLVLEYYSLLATALLSLMDTRDQNGLQEELAVLLQFEKGLRPQIAKSFLAI